MRRSRPENLKIARICLILGLGAAALTQSHANNLAADKVSIINACKVQNPAPEGVELVSETLADCLNGFDAVAGRAPEGSALASLDNFQGQQKAESTDFDLAVFAVWAVVAPAVGVAFSSIPAGKV